MGNRYLTADQRFDYYHTPVTESGCWLWTGELTSGGYAKLIVNGKQTLAHRYSFEKFRHPIPSGKQLDHLCRVRCCVNPMHLEPVSIKENVLRGVGLSATNARKTHCKRGHELSGRNLIVKCGARQCRKCQNAKAAAFREKKLTSDEPGRALRIAAHASEVASRVYRGRSYKSLCKRGHALSGDNVLVVLIKNPKPGTQKEQRRCRACSAENARSYRLEKRNAKTKE